MSCRNNPNLMLIFSKNLYLYYEKTRNHYRFTAELKIHITIMKSLTILFCGMLVSLSHFGQFFSQGPLSGSSFTTVAIPGSSRTWSNTGNASPSDNNYTSFGNLPASTSGSYTDYLVVTNFGFTIPSGVTITGIVAEVERSDPNQRTLDYRVRIVKNGVIGAAEKSLGLPYPAADAYQTYGGSSDLWGEGWTDADINAAGFGLAIAAQRSFTSGNTAGQIDDIRITVYYTNNITILPVTLKKFTAAQNGQSVWLNWETSQEQDLLSYTVERSSDGRNFLAAGTVNSRNVVSGTGYYSFNDLHPLTGIAYYRLRLNSNNGNSKYSGVAVVHLKSKGNTVLYPSVVQNGQPLYLKGDLSKGAIVQFSTAGGQLIDVVQAQGNFIPGETLQSRKGLLYYTVFDKDNNKTGAGQLVLQ